MFKKSISLLACCLSTLCLKQLHAQFYSAQEYGMFVGGSQYFGDLNPSLGFKTVNVAAGVFFKQHINPYIAVKGSVLGTKVAYSDHLSTNAFQRLRNLDFQSYIIEASVVGEFNFVWFETGKPGRRSTPYLLLGVGAFYYDPFTYYNGNKYRLKPIGTEGQNNNNFKDRRYNNFSFSIPVGVGYKYWIKPGMNVGIELSNRFTFTDYLDDVSKTYIGDHYFPSNPLNPTSSNALQDRSKLPNDQRLGTAGKQRGDRISFDQFFIAQISLSFQLKTYKCPSHLHGLWEP
jgi:hypothetical protein